MDVFDDFAGDKLDPDKWAIASAPLGDGTYWHWRDEAASVACGGGLCAIDIPRLSSYHDFVQIFDNPKHLYLATRSWDTAGRRLRFATKMAGALIGGDPEDYRDGFASFNVLDFESALVFDIIANGRKVWAICERLLIPGVTSEEEVFTEVTDLKIETAPMKLHECEIEYDATEGTARFFVDGAEKLVRTGVPATANRLTCGFGIITLHPIEEGMSVSCRGQGCRGSWGAFYAG